MPNCFKCTRGATAIEYGFLVALIGFAATGMLGSLATELSSSLRLANHTLAGGLNVRIVYPHDAQTMPREALCGDRRPERVLTDGAVVSPCAL